MGHEVIQRISEVAYKLKLPANTKIHHVFHVSCLKKHLGTQVTTTKTLPEVSDDGMVMEAPFAVLRGRMYERRNTTGVHVLLQWEGRTKEEATWEYYDVFVSPFPDIKF